MPVRLCSPSVVHHQLLGASGLPISLTQPQLRPDPNQEWEGKHEVARSSICALTPSAVKPPLFLSFGSLPLNCLHCSDQPYRGHLIHRYRFVAGNPVFSVHFNCGMVLSFQFCVLIRIFRRRLSHCVRYQDILRWVRKYHFQHYSRHYPPINFR